MGDVQRDSLTKSARHLVNQIHLDVGLQNYILLGLNWGLHLRDDLDVLLVHTIMMYRSEKRLIICIYRDESHDTDQFTMFVMQWGQFVDHDLTSTPTTR